MENVEGLIKGEAWSYVQRIYKQFNDIGYQVKHWLLKGEYMGVPQTRHRVFFIATRNGFELDRLDMSFNYQPLVYLDIACGEHIVRTIQKAIIAKKSNNREKNLCETMQRLHGRTTYFSEKIVHNQNVPPTLTAGGGEIWIGNTGACINNMEMINMQTFPQDYNFGGEKVRYICGMSVPPIMIKRIVTRLIDGGIFDERIKP
jgi:DNA (cytosine-5)-methyltransferase 1